LWISVNELEEWMEEFQHCFLMS